MASTAASRRCLGPVVVLLLLIVAPLGLLGARLVFAHLALLAVALTFLRSRMHESAHWLAAQAAEQTVAATRRVGVRDLLQPRYVGGMALLAVFPLTLPVAIVHVPMMAVGQGFGAQCFFQLWSSELFPTLLRSTAQGVMFAVVRITLGFWSFFVPALTATGFHTLAWILTGFLVVSGLVGVIWAPRKEGKSLGELEAALSASRVGGTDGSSV